MGLAAIKVAELQTPSCDAQAFRETMVFALLRAGLPRIGKGMSHGGVERSPASLV